MQFFSFGYQRYISSSLLLAQFSKLTCEQNETKNIAHKNHSTWKLISSYPIHFWMTIFILFRYSFIHTKLNFTCRMYFIFVFFSFPYLNSEVHTWKRDCSTSFLYRISNEKKTNWRRKTALRSNRCLSAFKSTRFGWIWVFFNSIASFFLLFRRKKLPFFLFFVSLDNSNSSI